MEITLKYIQTKLRMPACSFCNQHTLPWRGLGRLFTFLPFYLFTVLLFASCDDYLDVRPKSEKVQDDLFSDANGFESAIYGVYGSMAESSLYGMYMTWGINDVLSQDLSCTSNAMTALSSYDYDNRYAESTINNIWSNMYRAIGYANNVLQNLEGHSSSDLPLYNLYRGEMLAVRAFLHFDLLRLFGPTDTSRTGIPYVTNYGPGVTDFSTVGEDYSLIIADLEEAASLMQDMDGSIAYPRDNSAYYDFQKYRETHANYYAVLAVLAKVYWQMGDNTNAARYAQQVINSGKFPLAQTTEIQDIFAGKLSDKETLWGLYSSTYNETANSYLYTYYQNQSYNPYSNTSGTRRLLTYEDLYSHNVPTTAQDYRLQWFRNQNSIAYCLKNVDYHSLDANSTTPSGWDSRISGINLLHVAELYLIAADALLDTNPATALSLYNAETTSRGLPALTSADELTHDVIFDEYHKEMYGDGQVWYNMKRLNKDIESNAELRTIPASQSIYVLPIPEDEYTYRN